MAKEDFTKQINFSGRFASIDKRYANGNTPYASTDEVISILGSGILSAKYVGFPVLVKESGWTEAKEYWVQPKGTTPETYGLVEKGAGTTDYNDLENKPTISDGGQGSTQIPLSGNVKVTATAATGGQTTGVVVTAENNEITMAFTLEKGADGVNGTNGTNGIDGKSAYQEWLDEGNTGDETDFLNSLKAQIGKFIYVGYNATAAALAIGGTTTEELATDATVDSIVLMPNDDATAETGDPTATMMFSVSVSDDPTPVTTYTYIGDVNVDASAFIGKDKIVNDLYTNGTDKVLSANAGKFLESKLLKYIKLTPTVNAYAIEANDLTRIGTNYSYNHYVLSVNAGEVYHIGASRGYICYAFLSQEPQGTSGESLTFATGYSSAIYLRGTTPSDTFVSKYITIPDGCTHLWVNAYSTTFSSYNICRKREDKFIVGDTISFDNAKKGILVSNESLNRYILDGVNRWNKQTITAEDCNIFGTKVNSNTVYKHYLIAVQTGDVVCMATTYHTMDLQYALLTTNEGLVGGADLPLVTGTSPVIWSRTTDTSWAYRFVEIPEGCAYIWIDCKVTPNNSNTRCYKSSNRITYTDVIKESTDGSLIPSVAAVKSYAASNEIINNTNTDNATKSLSAAMGKMLDDRFKKWIYLRRSYPCSLNYEISSTGTIGTNNVYKHALIRVMPGEEYIIRFLNSSAPGTKRYCFLKNNNFNNEPRTQLPLVEGTSVDVYYTANSSVPQEKYIIIPNGCYYLMFDFYDGRTTLNKRVEKDNLSIPKHYQSYIGAKSDVVLKRDIEGNTKSDSFIFFSDYHVNNDDASYDLNYGHSPALIKHLVDKTNTKKVIFGGDVFGSPNSDAVRMEKMTEFLRKFSDIEYYPTVGNHEWNQSSELNSATSTRWIDYNYNSIVKPIEKNNIKVGHDINGNERPWYYFDNDAKKIRYVCLFAPNTTIVSGYANGHDYNTQLTFLESAISDLDSSWRIVIFQHIVYENGFYQSVENQQAIEMALTKVGEALYAKVKEINLRNSSPKVVLILSGHTHDDFGVYVDDYCYSYVITCDATYSLPVSGTSKIPPDNGTKIRNSVYEQSFDVVHLMPTENLILGERIGWGCNRIIHTDTTTVSVGNTTQLSPTISGVIAWAVLESPTVNPNNNSIVHPTIVASVDTNGNVTGVAVGDATIMCYTAMVNDYDENTPELEKNGYVEYFHVKVTA
jgi:hypothetical protein